jgi:hypothetical protein
MANITIKMKDGTVREFLHRGRAGGSYTKTLRYEGGMVVVEDEWGDRTAIPVADVAEVVEESHRGYGY